MFEFSVAFKYLIPRWRQLSVSIISLISILVIALVVWLITVFFSVTQGLEKSWIQKLIALTAPIRISPTEHYYNSYYYLTDSISTDSNYTLKSIGEKFSTANSDPYNPEFDQEIPPFWANADLNEKGELKDPVKLAFNEIQAIKGYSGLRATEYEMTVTNIKLWLLRNPHASKAATPDPGIDRNQSTISQASYLGSYDPDNPNLLKAMLPVTKGDIQNLIHTAWATPDSPFEAEDFHLDEDEDDFPTETPSNFSPPVKQLASNHLKTILEAVDISSFKTLGESLPIPSNVLPENCRLMVCALKIGKQVKSIYIPQNPERLEEYKNRTFNEKVKALTAHLIKENGQLAIAFNNEPSTALNEAIPLFLDNKVAINGKFDHTSLDKAIQAKDVRIQAVMNVQGAELTGSIPWEQLEVSAFSIHNHKDGAFWIFKDSLPFSLPSDSHIGDAILLPKSYRTAGVLIGDQGYLSYQTPTASSIQEQRVPIYIAGFYDPGILPLGGKIILANQYITSMIRSAYPADHNPLSNGINVRFDTLEDAETLQKKIESGFKRAGIDKYWKVETYREFEFTKDFLQQLKSERNLFTLISIIVIIVACSNIVSMLIILVNNKKMEIGILRSMGASSLNIALIFGTCGIIMGIVGSFIGLVAALFTLKHLNSLIGFISRVQGFDMFNPVFYGDTLPTQVSFEALAFVMGATALISLIAGVIPAVKASLMRPSAILRSE